MAINKPTNTVNQSKQQQYPASEPQVPASGTALGAPGSADQAIEELFNRASEIIAGSDNADLHNMAALIGAEAQRFQISVERLAEAVKFYRNPDVKAAVAYCLAIEEVAQAEKKFHFIPSLQPASYSFKARQLPGIPSFSRFYPSVQSEAAQLPQQATSNSTESNPEHPLQGNASQQSTNSNGNSGTAQSKGFGK